MPLAARQTPCLNTNIRRAESSDRKPPSLSQVIRRRTLAPFQQGVAQLVFRAPADAVVIRASVSESDLDAALERALAPWGPLAD